MKKIIALVTTFLMLINAGLFAKTAHYSTDNYSISLTYNETLVPGDAVFVRMQIVPAKNHKKSKVEVEKKAALQLIQDNEKVLETAPFYTPSKRKNSTSNDYLAGVPVSLWLADGNYSLKISASTENGTIEFSLPVHYQTKNFNKETIELNDNNTAIKTDNSPERMAQIEKLNGILFSTMVNDVYALGNYTSPTTSTRYTAYCGDRRVYAYSNGKSSTSVHYGNDYGIPEGSEIRSCAAGRVVMAENRISTGWSVVIEHLPGLYSLYYHCSELNVKEGEMVKQGELIAKSGSTGLATGPHLHWEMRLNGSAVRPEFFLGNFAFEPEN